MPGLTNDGKTVRARSQAFYAEIAKALSGDNKSGRARK